MSGTPYQFGNAVTLDATFLVGSTPVDPDTVIFQVRAPDGTVATYTYGIDANVTKLSTGVYECALGVPAEAGQYHYEAVGTGAAACTLPGEFYVIPSSVDPVPIPTLGPVQGPCRTWIDGEDIAALCTGADPETQSQLLDACAVSASMLAYSASGRQFSGECQQTVRPCADPQQSCWIYNWGSGVFPWWGYGGAFGYGWGWYGPPMGLGGNQQGPLCGCNALSRVKLSGYPVTEIVEVKIDGAVLPATDVNGNPNYRLDQDQFLTRMDDPSVTPVFPRFWPACQNLALDDTEAGTFSVTYKFGVPPPPLGIEAAKALACELFASLTGGPCKLPNRVTRVVRQGLTQERLVPLAVLLRQGATGIPAWDMFIAEENPNGLRRRPMVWSPDTLQYAQRLGAR